MPRIDVWDVPEEPPEGKEPLWASFTRARLADRYDVGKQLGQGGFGIVRVLVERASGKEYACKSIIKRLSVPNIGSAKQAQHLENIHREATILRRLRGTLNVVHLEDVFEDEEAVHLIMEWCKGGELLQRINTRHYSERTAASYMRAVLRTLAQCHHLKILHRDIKPGNFMLLTDADTAPVKAIDFGLAVSFDPKNLPRKDLGLEGTPHFMAPEQLSARTEPASDIWSAGVMAYQLLCGFVPFEDHKNTRAPALSLVWRSILTEEPKFTHRAWEGVSEQAKDFVRSLLVKDPAKRPTAKQALTHPWLQGKSDQRTQGAPLARTVVQRLQKFGIESALKRTVLDMIANDLINRHMEQLSQFNHLQQHPQQQDAVTIAAPSQRLLPPSQQQQQQQNQREADPQVEGRRSRGGETWPRASEAGEATPEGAAAAVAAVSGSPLPPPTSVATVAGDVVSGAVISRLRQLAAQDLLLRSTASMTAAAAPKHATVHAGGDALAVLRRGQQLLGMPLPLLMPSWVVPPPSGGSLTTSVARLQHHHPLQPHLPEHRRHSQDFELRQPLRRAVTSVTSEDQHAKKPRIESGQERRRAEQQDQLQDQGKGRAPWHESAHVPECTPPPSGPHAEMPLPPPAPEVGPYPGPGTRPAAPPRLQSVFSLPLPPPPAPNGSLDSSRTFREGSNHPTAATSATANGYKGPVKDLAAATAWDMSFMKSRLAMEGSGHALQQYAWLLNVSERSLQGVLERSFHAGRQHSPSTVKPLSVTTAPATAVDAGTAGGSLGKAAMLDAVSPASALPLPSSCLPPRRGHTVQLAAVGAAGSHQVAVLTGGSPGAAGNGGSGSGPHISAGEPHPHSSSPNYLHMLSLVARQRAEHRKYQRLFLDTSGHRQSHYEELLAAETAEAGADGRSDVAGGNPRARGLLGLVSPKEEDEDAVKLAGYGGSGSVPTPCTDVTDASVPLPGGTNSGAPTAVSLSPRASVPVMAVAAAPMLPAASPGHYPASAATDSASSSRSLPQPPSLPRHSYSSGGAVVNATNAPLPGSCAGGVSSSRPRKSGISGLEEADAFSRRSLVAGVGSGLAPYAGSNLEKISYVSSGALGDSIDVGGDVLKTDWEEEGHAGMMREAIQGVAPPGATPSRGGEAGKEPSLLRKVRKALMAPMKSLLAPKQTAAASRGGGDGCGTFSSRQSAAVTGTTTPVYGAPAASTAAGLGAGALAAVSISALEAGPAEHRGRGRGAYAAFLQYDGAGGGSGACTGSTTPQDCSNHGATERSCHGGRERGNGNSNGNDRSNHSDHSVHLEQRRSECAIPLPGPAGYAIHTVKAHKPPAASVAVASVVATTGLGTSVAPVVTDPNSLGSAAAAETVLLQHNHSTLQPPPSPQAPPLSRYVGGQQSRDAETERELSGVAAADTAVVAVVSVPAPVEGGGAEGISTDGAAKKAGGGGGVSQSDLAPALGLLLGDPAKVAELQDVMRRLQYDKAEELTYEQLSEGLQWLGYRLETSEVQDLLRQVTVGANEGLTASQFIASQVDWRTFQANHRAEWLDCLRKAFEELGGDPRPDGRVSLDQLVAALHEKLPEEEVNLAVQESLMDAAVEADEVDFNAFVRMMRCNSSESLVSGASSEMSYDLYDPRLKDSSLHGPLGDGVHYHPALETVPDDPE